jgi:hypothetical protein
MIDPYLNKFDLGVRFFGFGFLHNRGILVFGQVAILIRATLFQLLDFYVGSGDYFFHSCQVDDVSGAAV